MTFSKKYFSLTEAEKFINEHPDLSDKEIARIVKPFNALGIAHIRSCLIKETQTEWINLRINGNHYDKIVSRIESRKKNKIEIQAKVVFTENNRFDLICDTVY